MTIHSVNEIFAHILKNYPTKSYLYEVRINGGGNHTDMSEEIAVNCSSVNTPGRNIQFSPTKRYGIGLPFQAPVGFTFTEMTMTFYQSEGEQEREFFVEWQNKIFNPRTKRFGFYKDYVKSLQIIQYDKKLNKTYECKCIDCWPSNISPLDKSYGSDGLSQFNVNMQFYDVEEVFYDKKLGQRLFPSFRS